MHNQCLDWRFWDRNQSGDNRDDYMNKLGDRNSTKIAIMTDQSRQGNQAATTNVYGFAFMHGKGKTPISGWKNNLYGDGHAESRQAKRGNWNEQGTQPININGPFSEDELQPGWGGTAGPNPACVYW